RRTLNTLRSGMRDRAHQIDLLQYQVNEIESARPQPGELEALEQQLSRLKHAEKLTEAAQGALQGLADGERSAHDQIGDSLRSLEDARRLDESLEAVLEPLRTAYYALQDGVQGVRQYAE